MALRELKMFEVSCDRQTNPRCQGKVVEGNHRIINAYDVKHAHKIMRGVGWKVNDGDRGGKRVSYVCPACRLPAPPKR